MSTQKQMLEQLLELTTSLNDRVLHLEDGAEIRRLEETIEDEGTTKGSIGALRKAAGSHSILKEDDFKAMSAVQIAKAKTRSKERGLSLNVFWVANQRKGRDYLLPYDAAKVKTMKNGHLVATVRPDGHVKYHVQGLK
jgi:hypothetical protein